MRSRLYEATKRVVDVGLGTSGLLLTALVGVLVVPLIRTSSSGPVIYAHTRVGKGGKHFTCYKFRTMYLDRGMTNVDVPSGVRENGPFVKTDDDPRRVPSLRWLRQLSIDEMPQFWNVVRGDMSLVGPRPLPPKEVDYDDPRQLARMSVKPGLTGLWQVSGRSDLPFERLIELDLEYIEKRSLRFDLALLMQTIPAVVTRRGAY